MYKADLSSLAIVIKMKIIINLWCLQHERSIFNMNYPEYPALLVWGGVVVVGGGGEWGRVVVRKWKREAEKGDNEERETQIGQNNILVGRFV